MTTSNNCQKSVIDSIGNNDLLQRGENYLEQGTSTEAFACFVAAGLALNWSGWLRAAQILEDLAHSADDPLVILFREQYRRSLELAAQAGDIEATRRLAGLYEFGQPGLPPDAPRALMLLKRLADAGDAAAQFELFEKYLYGLCSAARDKAIALTWLRMAAQTGLVEAKDWLEGWNRWEAQGFEYPRPSKRGTRVGSQ